MLNFEQVKKFLPHRFPYLMIDKVIELEPKKKVVALKNVTGNEIQFLGHFPEVVIMPGSLIIEAMSQASLILFLFSSNNKNNKSLYYLGSITRAHFMKPVYPGDQLKIEANAIKFTPNGGYVKAKGFVENELVSEADLVFIKRK